MLDPNTECWIWAGSCFPSGYGQAKLNGKNMRVHIIFYRKRYGDIPGGKEIHHKCFNKRCVNPNHLEAVTRQQNNRDRPYTKLSPEIVVEMRKLYDSGVTQKEIGRRFGVIQQTVSMAITGNNWKEV